jgi:hypothetical protein
MNKPRETPFLPKKPCFYCGTVLATVCAGIKKMIKKLYIKLNKKESSETIHFDRSIFNSCFDLRDKLGRLSDHRKCNIFFQDQLADV